MPHRPVSELFDPILKNPERRARVDALRRAMHVITALFEARENRELLDQNSGVIAGMPMRTISRIDCEEDLFLMSLRDYVEEIGGELQLRAVFDDQVIYLDLPAKAAESTQMRS
jgi:hypothetical protein